jgi:hypothetical protein
MQTQTGGTLFIELDCLNIYRVNNTFNKQFKTLTVINFPSNNHVKFTYTPRPSFVH